MFFAGVTVFVRRCEVIFAGGEDEIRSWMRNVFTGGIKEIKTCSYKDSRQQSRWL